MNHFQTVLFAVKHTGIPASKYTTGNPALSPFNQKPLCLRKWAELWP